jgi:hypothetical protein
MGTFNEAGQLTTAYYVMAGLLVVSFVTLLTMLRVPDANIEDRDYGTRLASALASRLLD